VFDHEMPCTGIVKGALMLALTHAADQGVFNLSVGDQFTLSLDENPSTGYRWHLDADPGISLLSSQSTPQSGGATGSGGIMQFLFSAQKQGKFKVHAKLQRSWEAHHPPIDNCNFTIEVT
jgi:inhibitor of cysteine peptidase